MAAGEEKRKAREPQPEGDSGELMYVRCSVCGEWLDVKPGKLNWVSHGLCPDCHVKEMDRIRLYLAERRRRREAQGETPGPSPENP